MRPRLCGGLGGVLFTECDFEQIGGSLLEIQAFTAGEIFRVFDSFLCLLDLFIG
ncbi:MAG: hypothetical protein R3C02_22325 [Planctomycetaceae bacterium]